MKRLIFVLMFPLLVFNFSGLKGQETGVQPKQWMNLQEKDSIVIECLTFNSKMDDYSSFLMPDGQVFFNSDRNTFTNADWELVKNENIYITRCTNGRWLDPEKKYFFYSHHNAGLAGITIGGLKLFVYKTYFSGDIYMLEQKNKHWSIPVKLQKPVNSRGHEQSVAVANELMVISSDRDGGIGQHDLYWSKANAKGEFVDFVSLSIVNTPGDEVDVRYSKDGKMLFFSSNGQIKSAGGYDIFMTSMDSNGNWQSPILLDYPVNTSFNDRYLFDADSVFFLSSERPGSIGGYDIFMGKVIPKKRTAINSLLLVENMTMFQVDTLITVTKDIHENIYVIPDSAAKQLYYARVQIGVSKNSSVQEYKRYHLSLKSLSIMIEHVKTDKGRVEKLLIDQKFATLAEAIACQKEMRDTYKIKDAFIAVYNMQNERIAIYNSDNGEFVILIPEAKPVIF